jgi:hypothetical protein
MEEIAANEKKDARVMDRRAHPFQLALLWRKQLRDDSRLNRAKIAVREGISRARVTQIMDLLRLPAEIQNGLLHPPAPLKTSAFPERRLRKIVWCENEEAQIRHWQDLLRELGNSMSV